MREGSEGKGRKGEGHTIDQKPTTFALLTIRILILVEFGPYGVLKQLHRHLHRYDDALGDMLLDHAAELAILAVLLRAQQVPGRKVFEAVVTD